MTLPLRHLFELPDDVVYLDGNSLGPLPRGVTKRLREVADDEWGRQLIRAWNDADWMAQPRRVGDRIASLIGAPQGSVVMGDTLSIKVFQALAAALDLVPERSVVLSDNGNFPSDLYIADGLLSLKGDRHRLVTVPPEKVADAIDETVAVLMLTEVDYRTGRRHDIGDITARAHEVGTVVIWDLAHSAGAIEVAIAASGAEFAVGCTYKFINGGPGAPAFIYVRPDLIDRARPFLSGWLGHADPFAFDRTYRPASDIERMRVGTPPVLQMSALEEALKVWDHVDMAEVEAASAFLSDLFISEVEKRCGELTLACPRKAQDRGSQVSFHHPQAYAVMRALIDRGVIGDHRAPDILRFGITPLYLGEADILRAIDVLEVVLSDRLWDRADYKRRARVT